MWDTAGQESYQSLSKIYYRGAQAILLTYNIANKESFDKLDYWLNQIRTEADSDALIILVGN